MKYSDGNLTIDCADAALFKHLVNAALEFGRSKPEIVESYDDEAYDDEEYDYEEYDGDDD